MTDKPLLPCPFCGTSAMLHKYTDDVVGTVYGVMCDKTRPGHCSAGLSQAFDSEADAIAAWNRRPQPTEEEVAEACDAFLASLGQTSGAVIEYNGMGEHRLDGLFEVTTAIRAALSALRT